MAPLLVRLTVEPLRVEVGARPAPVIVVPLFTVPLMLSANAWIRSLVLGLGLVLFVVLVVVTAPLQVNVTGAPPLVAHPAQALELCSKAAINIAGAAIAGTAIDRVIPNSLGTSFDT